MNKDLLRQRCCCAGFVLALSLWVGLTEPPAIARMQFGATGPILHPLETPRQVKPKAGQPLLRQAVQYVNAADARDKFNVTGSGLTVAVLDTGLNINHADFKAAIKAVKNFSTDDNSAPDNISDHSGHGTNVTGIIASNGPVRVDPKRSMASNLATFPLGLHQGVAIGTSIVALKVLPSASWTPIEDALEWIVKNHQAHGITAVNMSIQSGENLQTDAEERFKRMRTLVGDLHTLRIPVIAAAGNSFLNAKSVQGMSYPAIIRDTVSVGAVYDADEKDPKKLPRLFDDWNGQAVAHKVAQGQIAAFTQRLAAGAHQTDVLAPGSMILSTGNDGEFGETEQQGSSQAAPIVTGIVLLMQEWYREFQISAEAGSDKAKAATIRAGAINDPKYRPPVHKLVEWLRDTNEVIDNYGDDDNVDNTNATFKRVDALRAFSAMTRELQKK